MLETFLKERNIDYINNAKDNYVFQYDAFLYKGEETTVVLPTTIKEFSLIVDYLNENNIPYLIRGAGTNYSGAVQPTNNDIVVSTHRIKEDVSKINDYLYKVSPSTTLMKIKEHLLEDGKNYPPDPASQKVCTLGGTIAMNAGGARCYMYGVTDNYIREISVDSPAYGKFILGSNQKYALSNYPVKHLFLGSEGTLGAVLEATISCQNNINYKDELVLHFNDYKETLQFIDIVIEKDILTTAIDMAIDPYIPHKTKVCGAKLFISIESDDENILNEKVELLAKALSSFDGEIVERGNLHEMRARTTQEVVAESIKKSDKKVYFLFDTVVPRSKLVDILSYFYGLSDVFNFPITNTYHAGDGNIHPTVYYDPTKNDDMDKLKLFLYLIIRKAVSLGGTTTGEHGVGREKRCVQYIHTSEIINEYYRKIKRLFDPDSLLNNGKLLCDDKTIKSYIDDLKILADKYGFDIDFSPLSVQHQAQTKDGLRDIECSSTPMDGLNNREIIPYIPIINNEYSWNTLFKLGIPSFLDSLYNLELLVRQLETNTGFNVGKKTLKNVEGFNLVPFYLATKEVKNATFRIMSINELKNRFHFYKAISSYNDIHNVIKPEIKPFIIDYYYKSNGELIIATTKIIEDEIFTLFDIYSGENWGTYKQIYVVTLKSNVDISKLNLKNWIYLHRENTLLILQEKLNEERIGILGTHADSIRYINGDTNIYIFLDSKYQIQQKIFEDLKGAMN